MKKQGRIEELDYGMTFAAEQVEFPRTIYDDISGKPLDWNLVKQAREEEMFEVKKHKVYEKVPLTMCYEETGKNPIGVRWVDINKGDEVHVEYRSRLVAQELKKHTWHDDLFAATPPLEAKKLLFSMAVTEGYGFKEGRREYGHKIDFIDVRRAYFHAKSRRRVFVKLPDEDSEQGKCGLLLKSMYGTRDAAQNWEVEYSEFMAGIGFERGIAVPCLFNHVDRKVRVAVHGDDFTILGPVEGLDWFRKMIQTKFEVKFRGRIGPSKNDEESIRLLNRVFEWSDQGITFEADQRHADLIVQDLGLAGDSKGLTTPGSKSKEIDETPLNAEDATLYRSNAARGNYLSQDRSDIQFAVKETCRGMANPTVEHMECLKRLARYLVDKRRCRTLYEYQGPVKDVEVYTDTDYAGCVKTRKSTSGGVIMLGSHLLKAWSSTQAVVSLSSGEAEYYGLVKGISQALGVKSMMQDIGIEVKIIAKTDASAAKGIALRRGMGKVRHIEVNQLWIQSKVAQGIVKVVKIDTKENIADHLTKYLDRGGIEKHMTYTSQWVDSGRHPLMPDVSS